jgi:hypothetical protein
MRRDLAAYVSGMESSPVSPTRGSSPAQRDPESPPPDQALGAYRTIAYYFDEMFRVPGTSFRFGLDSIVGLVPGAGDLAVTGLGAYALLLAFKLKAPASVLVRMLGNLAIDTMVGAVPLVGDLFDAAWKANTKNRKLLDAWLANPARTERRSVWTLVVFATLFLALTAFSFWLTWIVVSFLFNLMRP